MSGEEDTLDSGNEKPPVQLAPGTHVGKYRLERVLGSGAMGVVWCAHDPDLERKVAIKVLRRADAGPALRTRLLREARAMARLKHPNVLTVYEVGSDGDRDFIAMELVDGASLDQWLAEKPPADDVWKAVLAAGRGLAAAHAAGLVHRDFKPHNVLRSHGGRVLVTDFGLARGAGDEAAAAPVAPLEATLDVALDVTQTPRRSDAVLDSTLTQPGQLIGTPAYMAPEQYDGAPPDPRTDQFAFSVAAWQALTGSRPYDGKTLDDLRRAARAGVAGVKAAMPRGVRSVLVRGLSPDPAQRWPDLEDLLDALERAARRKQLRQAAVWSVIASIIVFSVIGGIQILLHKPDTKPPEPPKQAGACVTPDEAFAEVWTPARRDALEKRLGSGPAFVHTAEAFDKIRTEWSEAYGKACAGTGTAAMARLSCLLGERDELATYARLLETIPQTAFERGLDLWGVLPQVAACTVASPVSPPLMPEDRKVRDNIVALRAQLLALRMSAPEKLLADVDPLLGRARWLGWAPLEAEIESSAGVAAQVVGDLPAARAHLEKAAELAEQHHDYKTEAASRISLLEVELAATAHPGEKGRAERLVEQARAAVARAGDDPWLAISVEMLEAAIKRGQGELDLAITSYQVAVTGGLQKKAFRQVAIGEANMLDAMVRRGGPTDEEWKTALDTETALSREPAGSRGNVLASALADVAWRRGDLDDAHARADKIRHPLVPAGAIELGGNIRKADGTPAAGATIVAWRGELVGDGTRVYVRGDFEGDVAKADANGAFKLHAPPDGALIAELGDERSVPMKIQSPVGDFQGSSDKPVVIALGPTRAISGHVQAPPETGGIDVGVRYELAPGLAWTVKTARNPAGGAYALARVPKGGTLLADRDGHTILAGARTDFAWPAGATLDVIVRAKGDFTIHVLRGRRDIRTRAQLPRSDADLVVVPAQQVGLANETQIGGNGYQPGDLHAAIRDNAAGEVTACAVPASEAASVFCAHGNVPANGELAMTLVPK